MPHRPHAYRPPQAGRDALDAPPPDAGALALDLRVVAASAIDEFVQTDLSSGPEDEPPAFDFERFKRTPRPAHVFLDLHEDIRQLEVSRADSEPASLASLSTNGELADQPKALNRVPSEQIIRQQTVVSSRSYRAGSGSLVTHPLLAALPELANPRGKYPRFLSADSFLDLPMPMPRCQDVQENAFGVPGPEDLVMAVSHAWPHFGHPDAAGGKQRQMSDLLRRLRLYLEGTQVFLFFDFLSVPQQPFLSGQPSRTKEETAAFEEALKLMPQIFFLSDVVLHLDLSPDAWDVPNQGLRRVVDAAALRDVRISTEGDWFYVTEVPNPVYEATGEASVSASAGIRASGKSATFGASRSSSTSRSLASEAGFSPGQSASGNPRLFDFARWARGAVRRRASPPLVQVFDRVVAVAGLAPRQPFGGFLEECGECQVELEQHPFGRQNEVPAGERGWMFFERFVTMVKCAMLEEAMCGDVFITGSEEIRTELLEGAGRLRRVASPADGRHPKEMFSELLEEFLEELGTKHFTGASADAQLQGPLLAAALPKQAPPSSSDAEVVALLMAEFGQNLLLHWEEMRAAQHGRAGAFAHIRRAVSQALAGSMRDYLLEWQGFSQAHMLQLQRNAKRSRCWFWAVAVVPCLTIPIVSVFPVASPADGWRAQAAFYLWFLPSGCFLCNFGISHMVFDTCGFRASWGPLPARHLAWTLLASAVSGPVLHVALEAGLDVFPLPGGFYATAVTIVLFHSVLWFCIPWSLRRKGSMHKRFLRAMTSGISVIMVFLCFWRPLLSFIQYSKSKAMQMLLVGGFFLGRLVFERGLACIGLSEDDLTIIKFVAMAGYEFVLCIVLFGDLHWAVVLELVLLDVLENSYHILSLWRHGLLEGGIHNPSKRSVQQSIMGSLMVREFVELLVPLQFMVQLQFLRLGAPRFLQMVCVHGNRGLEQGLTYLAVDVAIKIFVLVMTVCLLRWYNLRPFQMLHCLGCTHAYAMTSMLPAGALSVFAIEHSHFGVDFSLQFSWLRNPQPSWQCGVTWAD